MESPLSNITITSGIELPDCSTKKPMQELPEGPLTDKNGKQWNLVQDGYSLIIGRESTVGAPLFNVIPHVERHPIFIDQAGNPVHEGDKTYFALSDGSICEGKCYAHTKGLPGTFLHRSDCEKWIASNVKRNTDKEMYEWAVEEITRYHKECNNLMDVRDWIRNIIKEKCL